MELKETSTSTLYKKINKEEYLLLFMAKLPQTNVEFIAKPCVVISVNDPRTVDLELREIVDEFIDCWNVVANDESLKIYFTELEDWNKELLKEYMGSLKERCAAKGLGITYTYMMGSTYKALKEKKNIIRIRF